MNFLYALCNPSTSKSFIVHKTVRRCLILTSRHRKEEKTPAVTVKDETDLKPVKRPPTQRREYIHEADETVGPGSISIKSKDYIRISTVESQKVVDELQSKAFSDSVAYGGNKYENMSPRIAQIKSEMDLARAEGPPNISYFETSEFLVREWIIMGIVFFTNVAYWLYLREENDFDEWMNKEMDTPLWKRVPGMEKEVLIKLIREGKLTGEDTTPYEMRLNELTREIEEHVLKQKKDSRY